MGSAIPGNRDTDAFAAAANGSVSAISRLGFGNLPSFGPLPSPRDTDSEGRSPHHYG
jgi:hypothetical protein